MSRAGESPAPPDRSAIGRHGRCGEHEAGVWEHGAGVEPAEREESYGPVTLTRHEKGDGRALILYTHEQRGQT